MGTSTRRRRLDHIGTPRSGTVDLAAWHDVQEALKITHPSCRRYTIHEARHTTATLLLEAGVDPKVIQAILGQSSMVATRGYQHVSQSLTRTAMAGMHERLEAARKQIES